MSDSRLVRMESYICQKCLKTLERVKGIEPSYSAWKAAALPLSYTRVPTDPLSRRIGGLNLLRARSLALTGPRPPPILKAPSTTKGGDPVSYTKRCHLAGIAR